MRGLSVDSFPLKEGTSSAYFCSEFVTSVRTSWFSSSNRLVARWPNRLSAKRGEASSFRHSIWPKCVLSPRVKRYSSLATLLRLEVQTYQHMVGRVRAQTWQSMVLAWKGSVRT